MQNRAGIDKTDPRKIPGPRKAAVTFQPKTFFELQKGINLIGKAIRPTLGPLPRLVALEKMARTDAPEFLDDGATIARRVIQIIPRGSDVGAMMFRHALWKMKEEVGDGTTTMGVIYQAIFNEGVRYITEFGYNPMLLRKGLETGAKAVIAALNREAQPLKNRESIARVATGMTHGDFELAEILGEIFDIVGADGFIIVEKHNRPGLEREYIEGTFWNLSGWASRLLVSDQAKKRTMFEDASLLVTDMKYKEPSILVPVLEKCVQAGVQRLVVLGSEFSDAVIGLLVSNHNAKKIELLAVRTPQAGEPDQVASMEDITAMSGGRIFYNRAKDDLEDFTVEDLGRARRVWASHSLFGLFGGQGDVRGLRQHISHLKGRLKTEKDAHERDKLQTRLGRLSGGTVILRLGGYTESEIDVRKEVANRTVLGIRNAVKGGVVAGGGAALLKARQSLIELPSRHEDEAIGYRILRRALEEPIRVIAENAGISPDVIIYQIENAPPGFGFDVFSKRITDMKEAGVLDAVLVLQKAIQTAVSGAGIALTTDVIVHHKKPKEVVEP
jgi:chaperonin GroEL